MAAPSEVRNLDRMLWEKEQDRSREELLAPGSVERLVLEGRVPRIVDGSSGIKGEPGYKEDSVVFIPPQGVRFGDEYHDVYNLAGGIEFFQDGKPMGLAMLVSVDRGEGNNVRMRKKRTLESIGMKDMQVYIEISEEEYHQLKSAPKEKEPANS
ncbi:MAG: hypothetical protein A3A51_02590 [Candidatus Levybacteria bacterium RIFCSPLOWO2_01_FULL_39_10]|nr:MAG: hypothetical protein A3A51_02590 [Candidatus Levybacteria bacterium RIFCSPLOWO2_01_FULL_39_10]